jgi:hypothetical protein
MRILTYRPGAGWRDSNDNPVSLESNWKPGDGAPNIGGHVTSQMQTAHRDVNPDGDVDVIFTNERMGKATPRQSFQAPRPEKFAERLIVPEAHKGAFAANPTNFLPVEEDGKFVVKPKVEEEFVEPMTHSEDTEYNFQDGDKRVTLMMLQENAKQDALRRHQTGTQRRGT